ncbi:MAG: hypothetical protein PVF27_08335, partial [Gemmatimonadales bacterium]
IEESLIFVQAIYLRAEGGRIPELKRVIVAYQNQVVMEETLEASLARLFGGELSVAPSQVAGQAAAATTASPDASIQELAREAAAHYERALSAQRAGDWATYGAEMRQVGELLRRLNEMVGGER